MMFFGLRAASSSNISVTSWFSVLGGVGLGGRPGRERGGAGRGPWVSWGGFGLEVTALYRSEGDGTMPRALRVVSSVIMRDEVVFRDGGGWWCGGVCGGAEGRGDGESLMVIVWAVRFASVSRRDSRFSRRVLRGLASSVTRMKYEPLSLIFWRTWAGERGEPCGGLGLGHLADSLSR